MALQVKGTLNGQLCLKLEYWRGKNCWLLFEYYTKSNLTFYKEKKPSELSQNWLTKRSLLIGVGLLLWKLYWLYVINLDRLTNRERDLEILGIFKVVYNPDNEHGFTCQGNVAEKIFKNKNVVAEKLLLAFLLLHKEKNNIRTIPRLTDKTSLLKRRRIITVKW